MISLSVFAGQFFQATLTTLFIFSCACLVSLTLGIAMSILSGFYAVSIAPLMRVYVWFFRGIPELIILLAFYLLLPHLGVTISPIASAILAFAFIRTAYDYEVFRGSLQGIHKGQIEASKALGLSHWVMVYKVVLPQMIQLAVGPWITQSIGAIKAISLASAISVAEIMHVTQAAIIATNRPMQAIAVAAAIYAGLSALLMVLEAFIDRQFDPTAARAS